MPSFRKQITEIKGEGMIAGSKLEPKIPFLRLQSHESDLTVSHLMNPTDYFINIQFRDFIYIILL